jgi:hypothetical protein
MTPALRNATETPHARFTRAVADLSDNPSAINVIRYLRASKELDTLGENKSRRTPASTDTKPVVVHVRAL